MDRGDLASGWTTARDLFGNDALIDRLLAEQARVTRDLDHKARAAYLVIGYGNVVSIVGAGLLAGFGIVPDLSPERIGLTLLPGGEGERRVGVRLLSSGFATARQTLSGHPDAQFLVTADELHSCFRRQVEAHFEPLVAVLRRKSGLSAGALWRLVGDSLAAIFLEAGRRLGCEERARAAALAVLKHPGSPLTNRELHYFDVSIHDPRNRDRILLTRTYRARGGCCRYYTSREGHLCSTCVLHDDAERRRIVEAALSKKLGIAPSPAP